jgi:hypothetical protein
MSLPSPCIHCRCRCQTQGLCFPVGYHQSVPMSLTDNILMPTRHPSRRPLKMSFPKQGQSSALQQQSLKALHRFRVALFGACAMTLSSTWRCCLCGGALVAEGFTAATTAATGTLFLLVKRGFGLTLDLSARFSLPPGYHNFCSTA